MQVYTLCADTGVHTVYCRNTGVHAVGRDSLPAVCILSLCRCTRSVPIQVYTQCTVTIQVYTLCADTGVHSVGRDSLPVVAADRDRRVRGRLPVRRAVEPRSGAPSAVRHRHTQAAHTRRHRPPPSQQRRCRRASPPSPAVFQ